MIIIKHTDEISKLVTLTLDHCKVNFMIRTLHEQLSTSAKQSCASDKPNFSGTKKKNQTII